MELTVNLEFVIAVLTIVGFLLAVMRYYGKLTSNYSLMQNDLLNISKELLEIKTIIKSNDEEIKALQLEMRDVKSSTKSAHHRLDTIENRRGEFCEVST